ncbi:MAG: HD domain-containing protein [Candidatus Omnitrophica bacterium]|nr:HD domain-containing protein [Candidatus Omnitrophota bacterium]
MHGFNFRENWRRFRHSLLSKLLVAFIILVIVPTALAFGISSWIYIKRLNGEILHRFHGASKTVFSEIYERERRALLSAKMIVQETSLTSFFSGAIVDYPVFVEQFTGAKLLTGMDFIELTSEKRIVVFHRYGVSELEVDGYSGLASEVASRAKPLSGIEGIGGNLRLIAGVPIKEEGKVLGVLAAGFYFDEGMAETLQNLSGMDVTFFVDGERIFSTAREAGTEKPVYFLIPREAKEHLERFCSFTTEESVEGKTYQLVFHPLVDFEGRLAGAIALSIPIDYLTETNCRTLLFLAGFTVFLIVLSLLFGLFLAHFILYPIHALQRISQRIAQGDLSGEVKIKARDEVGDLAESFNQMMRDLKRAFRDLGEANERARSAHLDTIVRLAIAAEYRDVSTANHIRRISEYSAVVAEAMGLSKEEVDLIRYASPMHDIGKLGIHDSILLKAGKLTPSEYEEMKKHTIFGSKIFSESNSPFLQAAEVISLTHHERYDGKGYPYGLKGENIPLFGRIVAIADVFDALTTERCYRLAFSVEEALEIIREEAGKQFDPKVVDAFFSVIDKLIRVREEGLDRDNAV